MSKLNQLSHILITSIIVYLLANHLSCAHQRVFLQLQSDPEFPSFASFMKKFGKTYRHPKELLFRFFTYVRNKKYIENENTIYQKRNWDLELQINEFADYSMTELFQKMLLLNQEDLKMETYHEKSRSRRIDNDSTILRKARTSREIEELFGEYVSS